MACRHGCFANLVLSCYLSTLLLISLDEVDALLANRPSSLPIVHFGTQRTTTRPWFDGKGTRLSAARGRQRRPFEVDDDSGSSNRSSLSSGMQRQLDKLVSTKTSTDTPTRTETEAPGPVIIPSKPKIVVLGASGKIGRLVVRQLLESELDATIVAFVRNYDKACRVLYDDMLVARRSKKKRGPKLQIIEGDLVPPEELPGYVDQEGAEWLKRAQSAASFYGNSVKDYDDSSSNSNDDNEMQSSNDSLQTAIRGCTAIISCVGSVRPTNVWTDFLARPLWRLLRKDVSDWCKDPRHPYYVHYASTRKALGYAEQEQLRREAAVAATEAAESEYANRMSKEHEKKATFVPRIRFVRISDLCVSQKPWHFIPILTNTVHSMVFRYQDMAERLLETSTLLETVVLRPGDLVDDERDESQVSLQVDTSGHLPTPARVGREDVAALAVASALFNTQPTSERSNRLLGNNNFIPVIDEDNDQALAESTSIIPSAPFHYTLAVRWASENMSPYPAQGTVKDGLPTARQCLQSAIKKLRKEEKEKRKGQGTVMSPESYADAMLRVARNSLARTQASRRNLKPYGICVAVPAYLFLAIVAKNLLQQAFVLLCLLPGGQRWFAPAVQQAGQWLAMFAAFLLSQAQLLFQTDRWQQIAAPLWQWIPRRAAAQNYLPF